MQSNSVVVNVIMGDMIKPHKKYWYCAGDKSKSEV